MGISLRELIKETERGGKEIEGREGRRLGRGGRGGGGEGLPLGKQRLRSVRRDHVSERNSLALTVVLMTHLGNELAFLLNELLL